jgi:hypothetical protein
MCRRWSLRSAVLFSAFALACGATPSNSQTTPTQPPAPTAPATAASTGGSVPAGTPPGDVTAAADAGQGAAPAPSSSLLPEGTKDGGAPASTTVASSAPTGGAPAPGGGSGSSSTAATPQQQAEADFKNGDRLKYGLSVTLLEFRAARPSNETGRLRDYAPGLEAIPPEVGFHFLYQPSTRPWRLRRKDGSDFQLISWGGMVLVRVDNVSLHQGALSLGTMLTFFENTLGLGIGFDLYRGIPVQGANGVAGSGTAYTGLLSWAFTPQGEITPENVFVVLTFGLGPIVNALTGELK